VDDEVLTCVECGAPVEWSVSHLRWEIQSAAGLAESPKGNGQEHVAPRPASDPVCEECESAGHFEVLDAMDGELDDELS
jgi:hypothetical protein